MATLASRLARAGDGLALYATVLVLARSAGSSSPPTRPRRSARWSRPARCWPGPAWEPSLGGFPALSPAGGFLIKDLALLGIALAVLGRSLGRVAEGRAVGRGPARR